MLNTRRCHVYRPLSAALRQVACQAYPLVVPLRSPRATNSSNDHIKSSTSSRLGVGGASASVAPASSDADRYGNSTLPAAFQAPLKMAAYGAPARAGSAVVLCLLGLLGSLGESPFFWVVFGGAVAIVAALNGGAGDGGVGEGSKPVAHFGFPAEFHLTNEEEGETAGIGERPQVRCVSCTVVKSLICAKHLLTRGHQIRRGKDESVPV